MKEIDWDAQWAAHGLNYKDGYLRLDKTIFPGLKESHLLLEPGPGFGDLSHSTTKMVVQMMEPHVIGKALFDVGSGSGVLTLLALRFGAEVALGIDIDKDAVAHGRANAILNHLEQKASFHHVEETIPRKQFDIIVMNMISSEQREAWNSVTALGITAREMIVSGILREERDGYIDLWRERGWRVVSEREESGWLALYMKYILSN